ncbi:MAG TPA: tetratricopeptide repeat protein, partial [Lacipirellula sp.]
MRKAWIAAWAVAAMAGGCAGSANPLATGGVTAGGAVASPAVSWTEKFKAPFKKSIDAIAQWKPKSSVPPVPVQEPFDPSQATPELYVGLAQMSERSGNIPQARDLYQKAVAKDPKHLDALLGAARMEDREGRLDVALMLYQRAATYHPRNATALNDLALCHARRGELPIARHVLEQTVQLEPSKPLYRNNLAKVLVELNSLQPAMEHLSAVHAPAAANYNMAVLLSERGRNDEATQFLSQALAIDPQMEAARLMLAQYSSPSTPSTLGQHYVAQPAPAAAAPAHQASDAILPTPEVVATVPWTPSGAGEPIRYPTTAYSAAPTPVMPPAGNEGSGPSL